MTDYKHKINAEGEYLPFYGYTSVSMLSSKTSSVLQNIEQLISQTIIGKYYSPLPHTTYHMTLFIYIVWLLHQFHLFKDGH